MNIMGHHGTSLLSLTFPDFIMLYDADFEYPMTHPFFATSRRGIIPGSAKHAPRRHPTVIKKKKRATIGSNGWTSLKDFKKTKDIQTDIMPLDAILDTTCPLAMLKVHIWKNIIFILVSFCLKHWVLYASISNSSRWQVWSKINTTAWFFRVDTVLPNKVPGYLVPPHGTAPGGAKEHSSSKAKRG